jgi:DNA polymerase-3 subunit gamma/tau
MSNLVLYRKYRPQKFSEVVSQDHVKTTLANAVQTGRMAHAYLFTGPRGVGKTTMARILSRAVNCPNMKDGEPCNECEICKELLGNTSLDFMEIDAASHTGVDNIRELIEHLQFAPTRTKFKVIIIDEVHMLSKGAFNALLKTLEEPPKHAIFILATTEIHKVPPTIISRTQRFDFKKVGIGDLTKLLKYVCDDNQLKITDEALREIAQAADGGFRDGLSLLDQVMAYSAGEINETLVEEVLGLTGTKTVMEFLGLLANSDAAGSVKYISELMYAGRDLYQFQKDFLEYLRKILLIKVTQTAPTDYSEEVQKMIKNQADGIDLAKLTRVIELFQQAGSELKWAAIPSLPLELAAIKAADSAAPQLAVQPSVQSSSAASANPAQTVAAPTAVNSEALDRILANWNQIMEKVKEYNHSLISSLKIAQPVAVMGMDFVVLVPYKFHKDTLEARKNRIIIDQVIEELLSLRLITKPMLAKDWTGGPAPIAASAPPEPEPGPNSEPPAAGNLVESALKIMGGQVE